MKLMSNFFQFGVKFYPVCILLQIDLMAEPSYFELLNSGVDLNDVDLSWGETRHTDFSGDQQPTPPVRSSSKKGKNFTVHEDEVLTDAYLEVTQDPIVGTEQRGNTYWKRVHDYFHANMGEVSDRNQSSLQHRWAVINEQVSKFCAALAQIENRNQSGVTQVDKV